MRLQFCLLSLSWTVKALKLNSGVLADVLNEVINLATAIIADWSIVFVFRQPEECRETANIKGWWNIVGCCIHFDDCNIFSLQLLGQFIENWSEFLAMSAWKRLKNRNKLELNQRQAVSLSIYTMERCKKKRKVLIKSFGEYFDFVTRIQSKCPFHCWWQRLRSSFQRQQRLGHHLDRELVLTSRKLPSCLLQDRWRMLEGFQFCEKIKRVICQVK